MTVERLLFSFGAGGSDFPFQGGAPLPPPHLLLFGPVVAAPAEGDDDDDDGGGNQHEAAPSRKEEDGGQCTVDVSAPHSRATTHWYAMCFRRRHALRRCPPSPLPPPYRCFRTPDANHFPLFFFASSLRKAMQHPVGIEKGWEWKWCSHHEYRYTTEERKKTRKKRIKEEFFPKRVAPLPMKIQWRGVLGIPQWKTCENQKGKGFAALRLRWERMQSDCLYQD